MYSKTTAWFMTGTGNSFKVATWFLEAATQENLELHQISEHQSDLTITGSDLLVFSYPTHGFTAPWLMMKHIFRLPKGNGVHSVVLPSRAGTRILGVSLPGMEGTAGYLIALLLRLRGYKVRGVSAIDMPSNWTAVHWGLNSENAGVIAKNGETKVKKIAHEILAGRTYFSGFIPLFLGLLLLRISFMYLILAQLILSKFFFASNRCNRCGLCRKICPKQAIELVGGRPYWTYSCDSCMACMNYCPQEAIQVSPFSIFLFAYVLSLPVASWLTKNLGYQAVGPAGLLPFAAQYAYTLISVATLYWLLHQFLRLSPVAAILAGLSHTKYLRRYHAPGISLSDIHKH